MAITGNKKENIDFSKRIGLFTARVIAINPTAKEYSEILGIDLSEDSNAAEYLGEKEGVPTARITFWLQDVKTEDKFSMSFFLQDEYRANKDGNNFQYINNVGTCTWATEESKLPEWFLTREFRRAKVGEEELYEFLHYWISLDYKDEGTVLSLDWKKLIKGNVSELTEQIDGEYSSEVVCLATVILKEKDDGIKEYQGVYNKAFLSPIYLKHFRNVDYSNPEILDKLKKRKPKELKPYERFALRISGEYGVKDIYKLCDICDYNPDDFLTASNKVIQNDDASY